MEEIGNLLWRQLFYFGHYFITRIKFHITAIKIFAQLRGLFTQRLRRLHHLGDNRLLDLGKLFRLHGAQFCFRLREERLITLPQVSGLLVTALQKEAQPPLTAHIHRESEYRIAQLLFGAQLVVKPRLNNLTKHRTLGRAGKFVITDRDKHRGQRGIRAASRFFEDHVLLFLYQHILVTAPLIAF